MRSQPWSQRITQRFSMFIQPQTQFQYMIETTENIEPNAKFVSYLGHDVKYLTF